MPFICCLLKHWIAIFCWVNVTKANLENIRIHMKNSSWGGGKKNFALREYFASPPHLRFILYMPLNIRESTNDASWVKKIITSIIIINKQPCIRRIMGRRSYSYLNVSMGNTDLFNFYVHFSPWNSALESWCRRISSDSYKSIHVTLLHKPKICRSNNCQCSLFISPKQI